MNGYHFYKLGIMAICSSAFILANAEEKSASTDDTPAKVMSSTIMKPASAYERFKQIPGLSEQEQWIAQQCEWYGLFERAAIYYLPHVNAFFMRYQINCPESQMRYVLKQLVNAPSSVVSDDSKVTLFTALGSCKDQTVVELGREITARGIDTLSELMLGALGRLNDPIIDEQLWTYLNRTDAPTEQHIHVFRALWGGIFTLNRLEAEQQLNRLVQLASTIPEYRDYILECCRNYAQFEEITLDKLVEIEIKIVTRMLSRHSQQYPACRASFTEGVSGYSLSDEFFCKIDPDYHDSLERYMNLKYQEKNLDDWSKNESVEYVITELAKLAPKFADKEKALAEAEAAYIAKYPDRAPVPIAK